MKTRFLLALTSLPILALAAEESISLDKLPVAAAEAIKKHAGGAKVQKVSKEKDESEIVYEASFKNAAGKTEEVSVNEKGKLMSVETTITIGEAPKPVQAAIQSAGKLEKLELVKEHGQTNYEALVSEGGKKREEITFSPEGKVVEREDKTHDKEKE